MKNEPNDNILYDPETGEPIYPKPEDAPVPNQFDPETGLPMGNNQTPPRIYLIPKPGFLSDKLHQVTQFQIVSTQKPDCR